MLSFLTEHHYIRRECVANINNNVSRYKIYITEKGLKVAEGILSEGLNLEEMNVIKTSKK